MRATTMTFVGSTAPALEIGTFRVRGTSVAAIDVVRGARPRLTSLLLAGCRLAGTLRKRSSSASPALDLIGRWQQVRIVHGERAERLSPD